MVTKLSQTLVTLSFLRLTIRTFPDISDKCGEEGVEFLPLWTLGLSTSSTGPVSGSNVTSVWNRVGD